MLVAKGNIWTYDADWRIITTNGFVKNNGEAVMGRGVAWQAREKFPGLALRFGEYLNQKGNHVGIFEDIKLITMPVKHHWIDDASLKLIERSALELTSLPYDATFVLPRPGCGNGRLLWPDVKAVIEQHLDDRFTVLEF